MKGYERNYDFGDLVDCAIGLNRLASLEYGEEAMKLSKAHVKQRTLWARLHPLPPGHAKPNLSDFARTPWTLEKELEIFGRYSSTQDLEHERFELNDMEEVEEMLNNELSFDLWDILEVIGASSTMEEDVDGEGDETNDMEVMDMRPAM
ncbi:hypothetical protein R1flu_002023 [Riccia fluitans]|uniref:Uncharacterized protein n=1 Tax=Riccia fluitans TaxID=41844 RepID=A0ABD1Y4X7_9MARC